VSVDHRAEYELVSQTSAHLREAGFGSAVVAIQTGSGIRMPPLGAATTLAFGDVPGIAEATAPGHRGRLHHGLLSGVPVLVIEGRLHAYEGHEPAEVIRLVRAVGLLGVKRLILTNSSGGVREGLTAGTIVRVTDHINLMGFDPLRGVHDERWGPRFPVIAGRAYDAELAALSSEVATDLGIALDSGVYAVQHGPCFETAAEVRRLRMLGVDVTGMSTVPEVLAAAQLGLQTLVLSLVVNPAGEVAAGKTAAEEVVEVAAARSADLLRLITGIVERIGA